MSQRAIYVLAFLMSLTAAHAEPGQTYFGVSAIFSGTAEYDDADFLDDEANSGFVLTYGKQFSQNVSGELSYVRFLDLELEDGFISSELTTIEATAVIKPENSGAFFRIGYSDADSKASIGGDSNSASDGGVIYGVGFDAPLASGKAAIRFGYTIGDYDDGDLKRLTIGTLVKF